MGANAGKHRPMDGERSRDSQKTTFRSAISQRIGQKWNKATKLYYLPLEVVDIILQKAYLHWILNGRTNQSDEEVFRSLMSVDLCFNRRITRKRFKRAILRYLKDFYGRNKQYSAITRNNRNYLLENIQPNDEFIDSLLSLSCITEEQRDFIQRQHSNRDKNAELLYAMASFDATNYSNFCRCLRQTKQTAVARVFQNGGVVIKLKVYKSGTTSMDPQHIHQNIEDLLCRTKPGSHETDELIGRMRADDVEILSCGIERRIVVVWIWCRSQEAIETIDNLYKSNQRADTLLSLTNIEPFSSEIIQSRMINIDCNQFKKSAVRPTLSCQTSISYTQNIDMGGKLVCGVTKLRNEIYVLCQYHICVFEDRPPFRSHRPTQFMLPKPYDFDTDIVSSEKENCLYVYYKRYDIKITPDSDGRLKITVEYFSDFNSVVPLSVSSDDQSLMIGFSKNRANIYGPHAKILRSFTLPVNIEEPIHAVVTSIGNYIILYKWWQRDSEDGRMSAIKWNICELTRDGQSIIRRFIPSNVDQELNDPRYLAIDSDDRVFVADTYNNRVILLDSDLKWNQILCPTLYPHRLCYDEENKQLLVGGQSHSYANEDTVHVYSLTLGHWNQIGVKNRAQQKRKRRKGIKGIKDELQRRILDNN